MFTVVLLTGCLVYGQAPDPAPVSTDDLEIQVRRLVRDLDSSGKVERDQAEAALVELGPAALVYLPEDNTRMAAEVKLRLTRVRAVLQQLRAEGAITATLVNLSGEQSLAQALEKIEQQTGNRLVDYRGEFGQEPVETSVDVTLEDESFWPAVDQLLDAAGLTTYGYSQADGLALVAAAETQRPRFNAAAYAGAFRIEPLEIMARRNLRDPGNEALRLTTEAAWEPRLAPIVLRHPAATIQAIDESGKPLEIIDSGREFSVEVGAGMQSVELPIALAVPPRGVQRIASLRGRMLVLLPSHVETFRFENLAGAEMLVQRNADVTVTVERVRKNNFVWEVRMSVGYEKASGAFESHRRWVTNNEAYLESPDGDIIRYAGLETTHESADAMGVAYLFDVAGEGIEGHTFVYRAPAAILNVPIDYELEDIPLP